MRENNEDERNDGTKKKNMSGLLTVQRWRGWISLNRKRFTVGCFTRRDRARNHKIMVEISISNMATANSPNTVQSREQQ